MSGAQLRGQQGVFVPWVKSSISPPSFWPRRRRHFYIQFQMQEWKGRGFEQTAHLSPCGEGVERTRREAERTLPSSSLSDSWLGIKAWQPFKRGVRRSFRLERGQRSFCLFVLASCCLFALVIGGDQKVLESTGVFVKGLSNIVQKIGNNKEKQKFSCSCSTKFRLLNKWLYEH